MWQIRKKLQIWSHLLKKSLMENFIFCAVSLVFILYHKICRMILFGSMKTSGIWKIQVIKCFDYWQKTGGNNKIKEKYLFRKSKTPIILNRCLLLKQHHTQLIKLLKILQTKVGDSCHPSKYSILKYYPTFCFDIIKNVLRSSNNYQLCL